MNYFLRVKYTVYYYWIAAAAAIGGIWLILWHVPALFIASQTMPYNAQSSLWDIFDFVGSLILGPALIYYSVVGALWVKNRLPKYEQLWLSNLEYKRRRDEERRHEEILGAERARQYKAELAEKERRKAVEKAERAASELKRQNAAKVLEERRKAAAAEQERIQALRSDIEHRTQSTNRQIMIDELTRQSETVEEDVKAAYEARKAQREVELRKALAAAQSPPSSPVNENRKADTKGATKEPEPAVAVHLTDKQIEQIALKAFRRISQLPKGDQQRAWLDWKRDLSVEYDGYVKLEILHQSVILRGEEERLPEVY